jgi:crotonobetainyl-CoA:carnitine CoA-transferase CaiB-like acyl-CoA transferase
MVLTLDLGRDGSTEVVNGPWKVDGVASGVRRPAPRLGQHTVEVLAEVAQVPPSGGDV